MSSVWWKRVGSFLILSVRFNSALLRGLYWQLMAQMAVDGADHQALGLDVEGGGNDLDGALVKSGGQFVVAQPLGRDGEQRTQGRDFWCRQDQRLQFYVPLGDGLVVRHPAIDPLAPAPRIIPTALIIDLKSPNLSFRWT